MGIPVHEVSRLQAFSALAYFPALRARRSPDYPSDTLGNGPPVGYRRGFDLSIVIDARCVTAELSGIARYTLGVISGLAELGPSLRMLVLGGEPMAMEQAIVRSASLEQVPCASGPWSIAGQVALPRLLRRLGCTVYHCPYLNAPLWTPGIARIVTVHDLIPQRCPQWLRRSWKVRLAPLWNTWFRRQCSGAAAIVTVSDFSRKELIEYARLPAAKVHRIYNGVSPAATTVDEAGLRARLGLHGRIISYVGRHDPYKNIDGLISAFARLCASGQNDATLVIAGKTDARYKGALARVVAHGLGARIVFTGYLDDDTRLALVRASRVFAFPSRYEGFGLPPLEAMAEGVPVVASDATSLPEVLGDAALLVSPDDTEGFADALHRVLEDDDLANRLREAGKARAARFTWRACAEAHLRVYERFAHGRATTV